MSAYWEFATLSCVWMVSTFALISFALTATLMFSHVVSLNRYICQLKLKLSFLSYRYPTQNCFHILYIWDKVFKKRPSTICGRQPSKNLKGYGLLYVDHTPSNLLKAVFHKFYLVHSWILCPIYFLNSIYWKETEIWKANKACPLRYQNETAPKQKKERKLKKCKMWLDEVV